MHCMHTHTYKTHTHTHTYKTHTHIKHTHIQNTYTHTHTYKHIQTHTHTPSCLGILALAFPSGQDHLSKLNSKRN